MGELGHQLQQHPSILPIDFDIGLGGDLILSVPPPVYEADFSPVISHTEFDDQRVPDSPTPQVTDITCCFRDKNVSLVILSLN